MGKLMKYELRSGMKLFIPLWLGTLILSFVNSFSTEIEVQITANPVQRFFISLVMIAYVLAIAAIVIITLIYIVMRFYQGTMKDEGYLTFTLPVGIDSVLWAKALSGMIVLAVSVIVCFLSMFILAWREIALANIQLVLNHIFTFVSPANLGMIALTFVLTMLTGCTSSVFHVYLSMGLGQMSNKHKVGMSVLAYVGINVLISTVTGSVIGPVFVNIMENWDVMSVFRAFDEAQIVWVILGLIAVYNLIFTAIYYFPTRYIFKNKLNLE